MSSQLYDRAAIVATTVLAMTLDAADELERVELQAQLEAFLQDEFADVARMAAADRGELP
jgi:hypothetical protein